MELVYLWVEEYKNIKNQGFNFSPRFICKYENGELTITENEHHSIFPPNINVTAIVGENGSGKSSIFELIIHNNFFGKTTITDKPQYFCIYAKKDLLYYRKCNMSFDSKIQINELNKFPIFIHYDKSFSKIEFYNPLVNTSNHVFLFPAKEEKFNNHVVNDELKNILLMMKQNLSMSTLYKYFTPNQIYIDLHNANANNVQDITSYSQFMKKYIFDCYKSFEREAAINYIFNIPKLNDNHDNWETIIDGVEANFGNNVLTQKMMYDEIKRFDYLIKNFDNFINLFKLNNDNILTDIEERYSSFKNARKREKISIQKRNFVIDKSMLDNDAIKLLINLPKSMELNIYDASKNMSYKGLSNGEKALLSIRFYLEKIMIENKNKVFIVLIDEAETDLHPQWQKNIISYLLSSLDKYNIHFIMTSHSPFILSDLPKENVIFLQKDKKTGQCINATNSIDINPFGANIHTLLSHGFFMEGGLMGEFAKSKIDKAITILNKQGKISKSSLEYCEQIISIIGEPILKRQLQRMLDSKRLYKMDEIDRVKADISELHQKLKKLENRK